MKPLFQEICQIPQALLNPLIEKYAPLHWTDSQYNVANPIFKNVSGQVIVVMAASIFKVDDPDIMAVLNHCFPDGRERLFRIMIANLQAGRTLDWHIDGFEFHFQCWRYHIPLISNDQCVLEVKTPEKLGSYRMDVGGMYTFNNNIEHRTYNHGSEDRINIIVDVNTNGLDMSVKELIGHRYLKAEQL